MRTVTFRSVLDAVVRRHGLEPDWADAPSGRARAIVEHINERVRTGWKFWDWPETLALEERAFRPTWTAIPVYATGTEVFYPVNQGYYRATTTTVAGQVPTDVAAWVAFTVPDKFIALDAIGATPIDQVFGVYTSNPRLVPWGSQTSELNYRVSEQGIDIGYGSGATVWIHFRVAYPRFSSVPYATGKSYKAGAIVYYPGTEECYRALVDTTNAPTTADWLRQDMPEFLAPYVKAGAYQDGLLESDSTEKDPVALQVRNSKAGIAADEADKFITAEVDRLIAQGDVHYHGLRFGSRGYRGRWPVAVMLVPVPA